MIINSFKLFFKKYWWQILIIALIVIGCLIPIIYFYILNKANTLIAYIYHKNDLLDTINLSQANDELLTFDGDHGKVTIEIKNHKIGIVESNCPLQYCTSMGLIDYANMPIICMYNGIIINIEGINEDFDIIL